MTFPSPGACALAWWCSTTAESARDAPTRQLLRDTATLTRHRLELPYGFDPAARTE